MTAKADGWNYDAQPQADGDCRKLVTLEQDGMAWIGLRAFHHQSRKWLNGGEPERATVKAWRDLPDIARGFWDRGRLCIPVSELLPDGQDSLLQVPEE